MINFVLNKISEIRVANPKTAKRHDSKLIAFLRQSGTSEVRKRPTKRMT